MAKNMSSYWKKQGQHSMDFIENRMVISPVSQDVDIIQKYYVYEAQITPLQIIQDKNVYEITYINPLFIINGFVIITENDLVLRIIVFGFHPNVDKNVYCLPKEKKKLKFDRSYYENFIKTLQTYYYDNCYYKVQSKYIKYKKIKSVYMQLNQESTK